MIRFTTRTTFSAGVFAALLISTPALGQVQIGPASKYYIVKGNQHMLVQAQGDGFIEAPTGLSSEAPLYVAGRVSVVSEYGAGGDGAGFDLGLNPNGKVYENWTGIGEAHDATTDGNFLYTVAFSGGEVVRARLNWTRPEVLFVIPYGLSGITYDPSNHSLWITRWTQTTIDNYDMQGNLLSSFDIGRDNIMALALDHADGTLWCGDSDNPGIYSQYTRGGEWLQNIAFGSQVRPADNPNGGEFDLGTPAKISRLVIRDGEHVSGELKYLKHVDGKRVQIRSEPGAGDKQRMECDIVFKSKVADAYALDVVVESRLNMPGGTAKVFVKNWDTGEFDRFETYELFTEENRVTLYNLRASKYVAGNGKIVVRIRHTTDAPGGSWKSFLNVVQARVRSL